MLTNKRFESPLPLHENALALLQIMDSEHKNIVSKAMPKLKETSEKME